MSAELSRTAAKSATRTARLLLENGLELSARVFGAPISTQGEVVFNTGMVGYPESLTDPSYRGQILVMTYPLIANYGVPKRSQSDYLDSNFESQRIQVAGLVVSTLSNDYSHWHADSSLSAWLEEENIVGLEGIDTRELTKVLRHGGTVAGKIIVEGDEDRVSADGPFDDISKRNLVAEVSVDEPVLYNPDGKKRVVLVDCGCKANIVRSLVRREVSVLRVPWDHDINDTDGDAIFVSNGPGDPKMASKTVDNLRIALQGTRPVLGICLGNQLVGRAAGCDTYKLQFGHRSQNQPCIEVGTQRCYITSQNHGYALDTKTLPEGWQEWFVNANDQSNEGIRHQEKPFFTVQFHPEATPGPEDTSFLFDRFVEAL